MTIYWNTFIISIAYLGKCITYIWSTGITACPVMIWLELSFHIHIRFYCITISNISYSFPNIFLLFHVLLWYIQEWFSWTHSLFKLPVFGMTIESTCYICLPNSCRTIQMNSAGNWDLSKVSQKVLITWQRSVFLYTEEMYPIAGQWEMPWRMLVLSLNRQIRHIVQYLWVKDDIWKLNVIFHFIWGDLILKGLQFWCKKCIWKCPLRSGDYFVQGGEELRYIKAVPWRLSKMCFPIVKGRDWVPCSFCQFYVKMNRLCRGYHQVQDMHYHALWQVAYSQLRQ